MNYEDILRKRVLRYARNNMDLTKWCGHMRDKYYYLASPAGKVVTT